MKLNNDGLMFSVEGLPAAQRTGTLDAFKTLDGIERIIEIGTCRGGFTLMLRMAFPDIDIHSYDIVEWEPVDKKRQLFEKHKITFHLEDVFVSASINNMLEHDKRTLILCDGGHKANEFTFFGPKIKKGWLIGGHDYIENGKQDPKLWTTCELWYDQIRDTCENYGLTPYRRNVFAPVVWGIFEK